MQFFDFASAAAALGVEEQSLKQLALALVLFLAFYLALSITRRRMRAQLKAVGLRANDPNLKRLFEKMLGHVKTPDMALIAFYAATLRLSRRHPYCHRALFIAVTIVVTYRLLRMAQDAAAFFVRRAVAADPEHSQSTADNAVLLCNVLLAAAAILLVLNNLGVNITALLTGLGIGGVAIALAAQAALGDIFAAFTIFLDRPFSIGDLIALDDAWQGTVERIGFKTTRVRAAGGELLIIPNSTLTTNKLRNFGAAARREKI